MFTTVLPSTFIWVKNEYFFRICYIQYDYNIENSLKEPVKCIHA